MCGSHTCDICQAQVTRISPGKGQGLDGVTVRSQGHVGVTFGLFHTDMAITRQATREAWSLTQHAQPVVDGDDNDITIAGEDAAIHQVPSAFHVRAAMDVNHDRPLPAPTARVAGVCAEHGVTEGHVESRVPLPTLLPLPVPLPALLSVPLPALLPASCPTSCPASCPTSCPASRPTSCFPPQLSPQTTEANLLMNMQIYEKLSDEYADLRKYQALTHQGTHN